MKLKRNIRIFLNYFLGPILFIWLSWSIYHQIKNQPNLEASWIQIKRSLHSAKIWNLILVLVLMIVNWAIEAWKWQLSVRQIQRISLFKSFKAILSGVSFSVSTPNRVGEYLGRVLYMEENNRIKAVSLTIVSSISQLIITILAGCIGFIILMQPITQSQMIAPIWIKVILYGVIAVLLILTLFYFRLSWLIRWVDRLPVSQRIAKWIGVLENLTTGLLLRLLLLSALRFLVFSVQYFLLFRLFEVNVSWSQSFWGVSVMFLVLAVIPSFAIAELGMRNEVSFRIIGLFSANTLGMLCATTTIWVINLVIPAIAGSLLILGIKKIFTGKNAKDLPAG